MNTMPTQFISLVPSDIETVKSAPPAVDVVLRQPLSDAAVCLDYGLSVTTGLGDLDRKIVTYYALATHAVPHSDLFPLLVLKGRPGTGKSTAQVVAHGFSYRSRRFTARNKTLPVFRNQLAECHNGTAVIEEADALWKDANIESLLSARYQRGTATAGKMVRAGDNWTDETTPIFGATILHRRTPFGDVALNGRSIPVRTRFDDSREYEAISDLPVPEGELSEEGWEEWWSKAAWWVVEGRKSVSGLIFKLPTLKCPAGIAARVFNTYAPLVATAQLCGDDDFLGGIMVRLQRSTDQLKADQSTELDGSVLRALIQRSWNEKDGRFDLTRSVPLQDIAEVVFKTEHVPVKSHQVGDILRDLGFQTKESHGYTKVHSITPATLIAACDEVGYKGEEIAKLRSENEKR